ncbi:MAG TPA: FkbM family methyltransferase [Bacillota bacterium]|nr:FkbM family methyltransferase [Bacillota bacterium]
MDYKSQWRQDQFLNENIFKDKEKGFFLDIGAYDGVFLSNSYIFERYRNWTGLCVEPNPDLFAQLIKNRNCKCLNLCISNQIGKSNFLKISGPCNVYGGIIHNLDPKHQQLIDEEIAKYGGTKEIIEVDCWTINDLIENYQIQYIDYLSLDVEGGELEILKSVKPDYLKKIDVLTVENNYYGNQLRHLMEDLGFRVMAILGHDEVYRGNN